MENKVDLAFFRAPEEEDPYGRCTNMKLTSFSEQQIRQQQLLQLQPGKK
jgi:hypothetical protein